MFPSLSLWTKACESEQLSLHEIAVGVYFELDAVDRVFRVCRAYT